MACGLWVPCTRKDTSTPCRFNSRGSNFSPSHGLICKGLRSLNSQTLSPTTLNFLNTESPTSLNLIVSEPAKLPHPKLRKSQETEPVSVLAASRQILERRGGLNLPLVSREWKNGSNSSYNCTAFLHSLLTKGKSRACP